ncbi:MAG TPA: cupredoxin domain-containing protein [Acidimicrobiia bacterium]|jgi:plastocyanin|nr:cupredoxin domain-containing protein [Acidimicrobiia bacterium]
MMRKWILAVAALVAVVGPGTGAVWMNSQPSQAADTIVKVDSEKFDPAEITVAPGASITWQNTDQGGVHTAKADDGSFDTGYIDPGGSSKPIAMSKAGSFPYTCELHPYKKGTVKVQ